MLYKYELHLHTYPCSKCAKSTVEDLVVCAKSLGYSGFCITNHFITGNTGIDKRLSWEEFVSEYEKNYIRGKEFAKNLDFDVLFGVEYTYSEERKEVLMYGLEPDFYRQNDYFAGYEFEKISRLARENGGVLIYAHPFRDRPYIKNPDNPPDMRYADGFEIINPGNTPDRDEKAAELYKKTGGIALSGGDIHSIQAFHNFRGIKTDRRIKTEKELAEVLKSNNFEIIRDGEL